MLVRNTSQETHHVSIRSTTVPAGYEEKNCLYLRSHDIHVHVGVIRVRINANN
jgi:hypothetical protein